MPTDNKKISAYVPDVIYDRFIQFQEEHELSMSKAAIEIFAAYFGINLNPTISSESTGGLQSRLDSLEKALADLQESHFVLSKKVDSMQSTSEPLTFESVEVSVDKDVDGELDSSLQDGLLQEHIAEQTIDTSIIDKSESSIQSELLVGLGINDIDVVVHDKSKLPDELLSEPLNSYFGSTLFGSPNGLLSELQSSPLKSEELAKRIGVATQSLVNQKSKLGIDDGRLSDWLQSKDPDQIKWVFITQKRGVKYIPANNTPVEKLEKLKIWIQANT